MKCVHFFVYVLNFLTRCFLIRNFFRNFAVAIGSHDVMKREPGEIPGQSRCCMPNISARTDGHWSS